MPRKDKKTYATENEVFPTRLRKIMQLRGETQTSLAEKVSKQYITIQRQTISLYTTGQSKPDTERLAAIAKVLDVSSDYLLGLSEFHPRDQDARAACDYTGLSPAVVSVLHDLNTSKSTIRPFRQAVINTILSTSGFWGKNGILERLYHAYQLKSGQSGSNLSDQSIAKVQDAVRLLQTLNNLGGYTEYAVISGEWAADLQIKVASDGMNTIFTKIVDGYIDKEADENGKL